MDCDPAPRTDPLLTERLKTSPRGGSSSNCAGASLPAIYPYREYAEVGGLSPQGRHAAAQIDEILRGANPGEIPFSLVTKYEFIINLKTARSWASNYPPRCLCAPTK